MVTIAKHRRSGAVVAADETACGNIYLAGDPDHDRSPTLQKS
jgi:hypothetical protein